KRALVLSPIFQSVGVSPVYWAGKGPRDHGTLDAASLLGVASRFWPSGWRGRPVSAPRGCGGGPLGPGPPRWLLSQPSVCLATSTARPIACSKEENFWNAFAS